MKLFPVVVLVMVMVSGCASTKSLDAVRTVAVSPSIPKTYGMISPNSANVPDLGDAAIDQIVVDAFSTEIKMGGGPFALATNAPSDATMHLKIFDYGLVHKHGGVGPFVTIKATLIKSDGHVIYRSPDVFVTATRQSWLPVGEYAANHGALRQGLHDAAAEAARSVFADLRMMMDADGDTHTTYLHN